MNSFINYILKFVWTFCHVNFLILEFQCQIGDTVDVVIWWFLGAISEKIANWWTEQIVIQLSWILGASEKANDSADDDSDEAANCAVPQVTDSVQRGDLTRCSRLQHWFQEWWCRIETEARFYGCIFGRGVNLSVEYSHLCSYADPQDESEGCEGSSHCSLGVGPGNEHSQGKHAQSYATNHSIEG